MRCLSSNSTIKHTYNPAHRFEKYVPFIAYSARIDQMNVNDREDNKTVMNKRELRRAKACKRFPFCLPRKGNDACKSSFAGKCIHKERSGLSALGRQLQPTQDKVSWH